MSRSSLQKLPRTARSVSSAHDWWMSSHSHMVESWFQAKYKSAAKCGAIAWLDVATSELELNQVSNVFCTYIEVFFVDYSLRWKKKRKKKFTCDGAITVFSVVLLKLSWWFFLDILKRCLGQLACMSLLPVWSEVQECLNGILHLVPEENAPENIVPITMLSQWY